LVIVYQDGACVFHVKPFCWLPGDLREHSEQDHAPYVEWAKLGFIAPIGESTNPAVIAHKIAAINGQNHIASLAFDRWRINDLKRELDAIGCHVLLEPHGQGFKDMSPAVDIVERLVVQKKLRHGAHPVPQWCAADAVVTRDPAGGRKFDKAKKGLGGLTRWWRSRWRSPWRFSGPQSQSISRPSSVDARAGGFSRPPYV
jgi:phage terminase large subunit-like protein